jgi:hypothetical protein
MNCRECGRGRSLPFSRYYPGIRRYGLRKSTKNFSQDDKCIGRYKNQISQEYHDMICLSNRIDWLKDIRLQQNTPLGMFLK